MGTKQVLMHMYHGAMTKRNHSTVANPTKLVHETLDLFCKKLNLSHKKAGKVLIDSGVDMATLGAQFSTWRAQNPEYFQDRN